MSNIAVIGAGVWGKNLVRTLHGLGNLALVAEASPELRDGLRKEYPHLEVVSDYQTLLSRTDIAGVAIATPAYTHHKVAKAFLAAGKDVFVEKPMAMDVAEAEDLHRTAEELGRILMVGHLLLYKPAVAFIRDYLAAGHLGKVFTLHQERMKLGKARSVENALWSLGVHDVAALLHIIGEAPVKVAFSGHCGLQPGIEDDTYLHMTFADGRVAHLHNSWLWPEDRRGLRIVGSKGMLYYNEKEENIILVRKFISGDLQHHDAGSITVFQAEPGFQALEAEMRHFLHCLCTRSTPLSDAAGGVEVIRVLAAAGSAAR